MIRFLKKMWYKFNYLGEPEHYNRGEFNYGHKYFTEFTFEGSLDSILLTVIQLVAFVPIIGVTAPIGNLICALDDDSFNINKVALRFGLISAFINFVSTLLWII